MRTKLSYYKVFTENLLAVEVKKTEILMNKAVCLELSVLELLCIIWYHYANQNCVSEKMLKLGLILQIMNQIYYFLKEKKVTGLIKDELGGKIMTKFVELRAETYRYLIDDGSEVKKSKSTKKYVVKRKRKTL